jgi:hypothetical protein
MWIWDSITSVNSIKYANGKRNLYYLLIFINYWDPYNGSDESDVTTDESHMSLVTVTMALPYLFPLHKQKV